MALIPLNSTKQIQFIDIMSILAVICYEIINGGGFSFINVVELFFCKSLSLKKVVSQKYPIG